MSLTEKALRIAREGGGLTIKRPHVPKVKAAGPEIHAGPIHSSVAGRTDHLPMHVDSGSYVLPADVISGAPGAEGNTMAGFAHAKRVFGGTPRGGGDQPYNHEGGPYGGGGQPYGHTGGPYGMAKGGAASGVPIVAAGGEYVVHPDAVRECGGGDLDTGHKVLDAFVLRIRKELIHTLKHLAPPKKD
jgi:hypothetical protein